MESIHNNQVEEVLPYQFEPEPGLNANNSSEDSDSDESQSSDEEVDHAFEVENAWRLHSLSWCKCGHCTLKPKAIESFCCHEKALEYEEYDALLTEAEAQGERCLTTHSDFKANMLSEGVLKVDVCRYLEDNWPLDDDDLGRMHKLYRRVAYQRCSRWVFQILGKKNRRPLPACVYTTIRDRFSSHDGVYTHFKYAKKSKW
ncbi:uncharacterized protein LOC114535412 [Dendronephthya gigantea]|uniref:uncharacterized protein LOC114535412 n=1 Tax=Dendronephthya gigantea TaxID=151771 RepID=UPI00106AF8B6|nr:uncharacterized protein LOC114535412 [Dendronephthya gigantea]